MPSTMFLGDVMHTCILGCIVDLVKTKFMGSLLVLAAGTVSRSSVAGAALMGPPMTYCRTWSIRSALLCIAEQETTSHHMTCLHPPYKQVSQAWIAVIYQVAEQQ